jgi:predicted nucleic acid-binding protein
MFVLDTNIVSELRKVRSGKANRGVATWAEQARSAELFISAITMQELEHGVLLVERLPFTYPTRSLYATHSSVPPRWCMA